MVQNMNGIVKEFAGIYEFGGLRMKEVLLSSDSYVSIYMVPNKVAEHLEEYCIEFACNWIWKKTNGRKLLREIRGKEIAVYDTEDFIRYLNEWLFPEEPSYLIEQLEYYDYNLPEKYQKFPKFNF